MSGSLVINAGSSSIKFAIFEKEVCVCKGLIEEINGNQPQFIAKNGQDETLAKTTPLIRPFDHTAALTYLFDWLKTQDLPEIVVAGHRIVHGGNFFQGPVVIDEHVLDNLNALISLAPLHQPHNIAGILAVKAARPHLTQVACFDTSFHQTQDPLATLIAIPEHYRNEGIKRYGFHGLSYEYIAEQLPHYLPNQQKIVVCHLGNGASLCAIHQGKSLATTMGFSTLDGLIMGTRPGLIDAGVVLHLIEKYQLSYQALSDLFYKQSGLKGISGLSNDMRELSASTDDKSRLAIDAFCYRVARELSSLAGALEGLEGIIFTGGIGENDSGARANILKRLQWLGVALDESANQSRGLQQISAASSQIPVWVIPTNEELVIARHAERLAVY